MKVDLFKKEIRVGDNVVYANGEDKDLIKGIITDIYEPDNKVVIDKMQWRKPEQVVIVPNENCYLPY